MQLKTCLTSNLTWSDHNNQSQIHFIISVNLQSSWYTVKIDELEYTGMIARTNALSKKFKWWTTLFEPLEQILI